MLLFFANIFQTIARFGVLVIGCTMVSIAIFTGALNYGITIDNILRNLPDAIPWFLLLVTLYLAWEYELIGGLVMLALGLFGYYLNIYSHSSAPIQSIIMLSITVFAALFIMSWLFRQTRDEIYLLS